MTVKTITQNCKPICTVNNPKTEARNSTVDNKKQRFEKLSLPTVVNSVDKKVQDIETGNRKFDSKALIDTVMSTKNKYMSVEKDFTLLINNTNSGMGNHYNKNESDKMEYEPNQNISEQIKMSESILEASDTDVECNNPNYHTGNESANQSKTGQTKMHKFVTKNITFLSEKGRNMKNKNHSVKNSKSNISAKTDHDNVGTECLKNDSNGKTKQSAFKLCGKNKPSPKDHVLNIEMQSGVSTQKYERLMSTKTPDAQSSYSNRSKSMVSNFINLWYKLYNFYQMR